MITTKRQPTIIMEEITDSKELAQARQRDERFQRNLAWMKAHASEVYSGHRGKYICIAGEELYVAETALEARSLAVAAHPEDDGYFLHYIPREKMARIYANQRRMAAG